MPILDLIKFEKIKQPGIIRTAIISPAYISTLSQYLQKMVKNDLIKMIFCCVLAGINAFSLANYSHCDIKPNNPMLDSTGFVQN